MTSTTISFVLMTSGSGASVYRGGSPNSRTTAAFIVSAVAAKHDLSLTLLRVGAILRDRTLTMSELAAYLGLDRSTITGLINRASERHLVRRVGNENDKRSSRVTLTEAGQALAATCASEISRKIAPLVARLTPVERDRLTKLLALALDEGTAHLPADEISPTA